MSLPFKDFGCDVPELTAAVFLEPGKIVRLGVPPLRLEVMNEISGVSFDQCHGQRVVETIAGIRICFIDRESLLLNLKTAVAWPQKSAKGAKIQVISPLFAREEVSPGG